MTDHTASLALDTRYAQHYRGMGDRDDGAYSAYKHVHRNSAWCDSVSLLESHHACKWCCDTGTQPCGTLIPHPYPGPDTQRYANGYHPLPHNKRHSGVIWFELGFWVIVVAKEDRPKVPESAKKGKSSLVRKASTAVKRATRLDVEKPSIS